MEAKPGPNGLLLRWTQLMARLDVHGHEPLVFGMNVVEEYQRAGRFYHNETHLRDVLQKLDWARQALADSGELKGLDLMQQRRMFDTIELALWYHDVIYDAKAKDNEARSSALLREHAAQLGIPADIIAQASNLVDITAHHGQAKTLAECILTDCDLAILGADKKTFKAYDDNIRKEYAHVPAPLYKQGRAKVLKGFLAQDPIFKTQAFRDSFETAAKKNLKDATTGFSLRGIIKMKR